VPKVPDAAPVADPPQLVPGAAHLPGGSSLDDNEAVQLFASLPMTPGVRRAAGLFWVAAAIVLIGIVIIVVIITGAWPMSNVRGAVTAGVCLALVAGSGFCVKTAIGRLLPRV
jgi:hypothetical protein